MLMCGVALLNMLALIDYLVITGNESMLVLVLNNLLLISAAVLMLAGSAQFDKVASGVNNRLSNGKH